MSFEAIITFLGKFNLYAWIIAAVASFMVQKYIKNKGWMTIFIGSLFVVVRMAWKLAVSGYGAAGGSEVLFNAYMMRYIFGAIGAILVSIGLIQLIVNYYVVRSALEV